MSILNIPTVDAAKVCAACLPFFGAQPIGPTPDAISAIANSLEWKTLPNWEHHSDSEIAAQTSLDKVPFVGPLFVVTEASLTKYHGAFVLGARDLVAFVEQHLARFGECFFNGDVIVVESEGGHIWLFHHEGLYALISAHGISPGS